MMTSEHALATIGAALILSATPAAAAGDDNRPVVVHVRDYARVPGFALAGAQREATEIFATAGVRLVWAPAKDAAPPDPDAVHLRVFILSGDVIEEAGLGEYAHRETLGLADRLGGFAFILYPHLRSLVPEPPFGLPMMLGGAMAHELGHLLLPDSGHSPTGIMRAQMDRRPIRRQFTYAQATAMRRTLSAALQASR
jgi:hypothetical protein